MKCCSLPPGPPTTFRPAPPEAPFLPTCREFDPFSTAHMLLYGCLFALVRISSPDGFSMKIIPTCLIFNFTSCHFLFKCAFFFFFFSRCIFWQNNFLRASVGVNGTFIYYPRQLQFLGGQGSSAVVQRGNKSSCNSGHAMSLLWPHREGEDLRTLATSVHEGFSSYQCASQPGV